jgi:hypothetical protein
MALNFANNNSLSAITALPSSVSGGAMTLLSTQTASGSATISFTSGIDSTYDSYVFKFYNMHSSDNGHFQFNMSIDSGSNYNVTKTTSYFEAVHDEADSATSLAYKTARDLAQSTGYQILANEVGTDNDQNASGTLTIFNPSSTVFVKHFIANFNSTYSADYTVNSYIAGYGNTTSAVDAIRFQFSSGTFDGVIKLYGIS